LFILSGAYLLLNAASYDGEILHADEWRPCAGHLLCFMSIGVVVTKNWHFSQKLSVHVQFRCSQGRPWRRAAKACAINSVTINSTWGRWMSGCMLGRCVSAQRATTACSQNNSQCNIYRL